MSIDFSSLETSPAHSGHVDFSALGAVPAVGSYGEEETSALGAAGRGAVEMLPLGKQAYAGIESLVDKTPYLSERKELEKDIQKDIELHPTARLAGQVAGVAAPIVATAGLAAPETILGAAGQGAVFGGATGAGNAIDTLASGGSGAQAAGDIALGAGLGAAGGAAGQAAGKLLSKTASTVLPSAEEVNAHAIAGVLGGTPRQIRALPGKNPMATLAEMGDVMRQSTVNGQPLVEITDQFPTRLNKFIQLNRTAGKTLGDLREAAGVPAMEIAPIEQSLLGSMKIAAPEEKAHMEAVIAHMKSYAPDGKIPFNALQKLKEEVGDRAFTGQGNPVLQNAYHVISDVQEAELEKVPDIVNKTAYNFAKKQYQVTSRALPMLKMAVAKEVAGKANLTVPGAALVTGHPVVAAGALMKPRLEQMLAGAAFKAHEVLPDVSGNIAARTPSVAGAIAGAKEAPTSFNLDHPALAPWKPVFEKNAANAKDEGELKKSQAVTDFVLSQRDPAYAKAKQKTTEEPIGASEPIKMADGGVVETLQENFGRPVEGFNSTLEGVENVMKGAKAKPVPMEEKLPTTTDLKFHQPFNTDMEDKLKAFLLSQKEAQNAQPR